MKSVLITGKHSYLGNSLRQWLTKKPDAYCVDMLDLKDPAWREMSLNQYDAVVHMAGIAHVPSGPSMADLYFAVNRDLAVETAQMAKACGVGQFVFMSSIKIFGDRTRRTGVISLDTSPEPSDHYGESKLQAENALLALESDGFQVAVVRAPMVYGKHSKGNYPRLARLAQKSPVFPDYDNYRSMIHVDNLCELLRLLIDDRQRGIYHPQNQEYVRTSELVRAIARAHGRDIRVTRVFNGLIGSLQHIPTLNRVFGDLAYEMSMSAYPTDYRIRSFEQSITATER